MGLRFQKRIRLFKGLTLNLSKTGTSFSLGGRGARVNIRGNKVTGTVGIPGTGISYRERLDKKPVREVDHDTQQVNQDLGEQPINGWKIVAFLLVLIIIWMAISNN